MGDERLVSASAPYTAGSGAPPGDAWAAEAAAAGGAGSQRITFAGPVPATADVARALCVEAGVMVVARRRLVLLDGAPVETADAYYPETVAGGTPLAKPSKIPGGAAALLAGMGFGADRVREEIHARVPTPEEQQALHLPEREPVLVLTRVSFTSAGTPFEYAVMTMRSAGRVLRYDLPATS
jgi:GntR family transcriptional regulator